MKKRTDILFLMPSLVGFLVFFIVPSVASLRYAFINNAFDDTFVGLRHFRELWQSEYFRLAVKNTVLFTLTAVPAVMVLSVVIASLVVRFAPKIPLVKTAFFLPVVLPSASLTVLYNAYFSHYIPPFPSVLLVYLWKYGGLNVMLIITAITCMDKTVLDAAKIDGAGYARCFIHIILPNITPTLFFTLILSLVNSFRVFRESYLLYGAYPDDSVYMLTNYINNHFEKLNYQNISTAAICFGVIVCAAVAAVFLAEKKRSERIW